MKKKILTLDDYQEAARRTAIYPYKGKNLIYTAMGLAGETGEFCNKVKKLMRSYGLESNSNTVFSLGSSEAEKLRNSLKGELGGILWYVSACATELGITLNQIGINNIDELSARVKNDTIEGEGDER